MRGMVVGEGGHSSGVLLYDGLAMSEDEDCVHMKLKMNGNRPRGSLEDQD